MPSARALPEFVLQAIPCLGGRPSNPTHKAREKSHSLQHTLPTLLYNSGCSYVKTPESNLTMLMKCPDTDVNCMYSHHSTVIGSSERTGREPSSSGWHPCEGVKQRVSHGTCESTTGTFTVTYTVVIRLPSLAKGGLEEGPW